MPAWLSSRVIARKGCDQAEVAGAAHALNCIIRCTIEGKYQDDVRRRTPAGRVSMYTCIE